MWYYLWSNYLERNKKVSDLTGIKDPFHKSPLSDPLPYMQQPGLSEGQGVFSIPS